MKDIKTILEGYELTDEQKSEIAKTVNENYKTVEEVAKKSKRIEELEKANEELTAQVEAMPDNAEVEKLKEQVQTYKDAEKQRKADEAEAEKRKSFNDAFNAALDGKEFVNQFTRDSVFEKAYERCKAETSMNAADAIKELTGGDETLFKNPQHDPHKMPDPKTISHNKDEGLSSAEDKIRNFMFPKRSQ